MGAGRRIVLRPRLITKILEPYKIFLKIMSGIRLMIREKRDGKKYKNGYLYSFKNLMIALRLAPES